MKEGIGLSRLSELALRQRRQGLPNLKASVMGRSGT
jgi:hypothetical protein